MSREIRITHAKQNNLKDISLSIPKHKITVFTGVSGSGKSSLVIDTLGAESQRLLNESYSSYIQNLLPHYVRPNVDVIEGLPVSIIVNQKKLGGNARSTVGTVTDIYALLRLLYSRVGQPFVGYSMVFSFNNRQGMCERCEGLGIVRDVDVEKLIDVSKSLNEGAIRFPTFQPGGWRLSRYTESGFFDNDLPIEKYSDREKALLLFGDEQYPHSPSVQWHKSAKYVGIVPRIEDVFLKKDGHQYKEELEGIISSETCPVCHGYRLNSKSLSCKIQGKSIGDCVTMSLKELYSFLSKLNDDIAIGLINRILLQLNTLIRLGLGYLSLGRMTNTLSGGESQRVKMSKYLNSSLSDVLYIFDEPSIGLHPHDLKGVNALLKGLVDKGNTVIAVEHDPDVIKIADHIIDMGPDAGKEGGEVCFEGSYKALLNSQTKTGQALRACKKLKPQRVEFKEFYELQNVSMFNIKNVSIKLPKQGLTVVTGVAGSGKSTLISRLFVQKYSQSALLDQSKIYASERSNIVTFLDTFDDIRGAFAKTTGQPLSLFSFNGKGGCPVCKGRGYIKTDFAFLGDVELVCDACHGTRYSKTALKHRYNGYDMSEVLKMSVIEALRVFNCTKIQHVLKMVKQVNLGYIALGQSLDSFSGGELQRLKLAKTLLFSDRDILVLDEPSTGLHEFDIEKLLDLFDFIVNQGKTLIVMEHNLSVMCHADWVIDLGPGGGTDGGEVLYMGYLAGLLSCERSYSKKSLEVYVS